MTQNIFFIGDTHFGQHTMCKFTRDDGSKLRPFDTIEEMVGTKKLGRQTKFTIRGI